jgi:hypothetical protein
VGNIFIGAELGHTPKPDIFIWVILVRNNQINLYASSEKSLEAINTYIVIGKDDCAQLFFL